jgi:hypothetical protein
MTTRITVASIEQKPKRSVIITPEGRRYGCFSEKLAAFGFELNGVYDVETTTHESGGITLTNIVKAKRIAVENAAASPAAQQATAAPPPAANSGGNGNGHSKDEQIFVQGLLQSLIRAGEIHNDKRQLWETTVMLRNLWRATFGGTGTFTPSEAGQRPRLQAAE